MERARKNQQVFFHREAFSRGATRSVSTAVHTRERPFWLDASCGASCSSSRWRSSSTLQPLFPLSLALPRHERLALPNRMQPATLCSLLRVFSPTSLFSPLLSPSHSTLSFLLFLPKLEEEKKEDQGEYTAEVIKGVGVYSWVLYPLLETLWCSRGTRGTRGSVAEQSFRELWSFLGYTPPSIPLSLVVPSATYPLAS